MECAALSSHLVTQSSEDFFRVRVLRAPVSTVVPSRFSPADLAGNPNFVSSRSRGAVFDGAAKAISKPGSSQASSAGQSGSNVAGQNRGPIDFSLGKHCPSHPCQLVGQGHGDDVVMCSRRELCQPNPQTGRLLFSKLQDRSCALDKESSQVGVSAFTDAEQLLLASGGAFPWDQPDTGVVARGVH